MAGNPDLRLSLLGGYPQIKRLGLTRSELAAAARFAAELELDSTEAMVRFRPEGAPRPAPVSAKSLEQRPAAADEPAPGPQAPADVPTAVVAFFDGGLMVDSTVTAAGPEPAPPPTTTAAAAAADMPPFKLAERAVAAVDVRSQADQVPLYDCWTDEVIGEQPAVGAGADEPSADGGVMPPKSWYVSVADSGDPLAAANLDLSSVGWRRLAGTATGSATSCGTAPSRVTQCSLRSTATRAWPVASRIAALYALVGARDYAASQCS